MRIESAPGRGGAIEWKEFASARWATRDLHVSFWTVLGVTKGFVQDTVYASPSPQ